MRASALLLTSLALFAAGCYREPVPASKTVPAGARLYLQDKALKDLSACAEQLQPAIVDYVNLDRNQLAEFPQELLKLTRLKWLRLNDNRLSSLPSLEALTNLRRIYLKNNRFLQVPEGLKLLPALTDIDLSGNPLTEVPLWLAQKKGLENLSLTGTRISALPADLSAWRSLKSLQLGQLSLSAAEMARIRSQLPDVAIVF
jgi:Leucine-rich repeat (LRR) protein